MTTIPKLLPGFCRIHCTYAKSKARQSTYSHVSITLSTDLFASNNFVFFFCLYFFLYCSGNVSVLHAFTKVWREDFHSNNKIQNEAVEVMNNYTQIYSSGNMSYIQHTYICTIPVWWKVVNICICNVTYVACAWVPFQLPTKHGLGMRPSPSLISFKYIKLKENKIKQKKVTLLPALVYQNSQYLRKMRNRKTTTAMAALAASEDRRLR